MEICNQEGKTENCGGNKTRIRVEKESLEISKKRERLVELKRGLIIRLIHIKNKEEKINPGDLPKH